MLAVREPQGDQQWRRWRPALVAFFLKRTRDHAEAEDLAQETLARVFGGTGAAGSHSGYIFQVAANLLRDRGRRRQVRSVGQETVESLYGRSVDWLDPERIAVGRNALSRLVAKLGDLPERTRAIFILYRVENIEKRVIAESFGISASAVEKHVTRCMAHLMACAREDRAREDAQ